MKTRRYIEERPTRLLNIDRNVKTVKGRKRGYMTGILYLYPFKSWGFNICPNAERADCWEPCLNTAGRGAMTCVQQARLRKTRLFHEERDWFMAQLWRDTEALIRKAQREVMIPCIRLNGLSDLDWENIRYQGESSMERYPLVQHYDYTKLPRVPKSHNYHLTFSYSEAPAFLPSVQKAMRLGMSMAVVSTDDMPKEWMGRQVVNGDADDLRFLDPPGCIVWLKAKGKARKSDSNLIVRAA